MTMVHRSRYPLALLVFVAVLLLVQYSGLTWRPAFVGMNGNSPVGLERVDCWFTGEEDWPASECYNVHVPENHLQPEGTTITFPLLIFRSRRFISFNDPVLHLGGGGPGAPMYLDDSDTVRTLWEYHDEFSLDMGRDLFLIDPRGTGLARPLLTCNTFVDNEILRLPRNLNLVEHWRRIDEDYLSCFHHYREQGVNLATYNSLSIAKDIELLRKLTHTNRWLLYGVSYAATYAQLITNLFPDSVEAMILDSATFPNLKPHHRLVEYTMAPYEKLYNYCDVVEDCDAPVENVQGRIWALHVALNLQPIMMELPHPFQPDIMLRMALNGERFLAALLQGIYGTEVFNDLPQIIIDLEKRQTDSLLPYLENHLAYLLDRTYGDVSDAAHQCYETIPFTDKEKMREQAQQLPAGYLREVTLLGIDWPDYCGRLDIGIPDPRVARLETVTVPTLFLHGRHDTVTLLDDVLDQLEYFQHSQVVVYPVAHSVMTADGCAELVASRFVARNGRVPVSTDCF